MTIEQAIREADILEPNTYGREEKVGWLSRLDGRAFREVIRPRQEAQQDFAGYPVDAAHDTALLIQYPWDDVYAHWLRAQYALHNGENDRYNDAMTVFTEAWQRWSCAYAQSHRDRSVHRLVF